jgi:hypothetical protein
MGGIEVMTSTTGMRHQLLFFSGLTPPFPKR